MALGYNPGEIIGGFQVIEKIGSYLESNGSRQGLYRVRCLTCGEEIDLISTYIRAKKDCGCRKREKCASATRLAKNRSQKRVRKPWMSEGEIYRAWLEMRDRALGYSILAQLNDVPVKIIVDIIKKRQEDLRHNENE